MNRRVVYGLLLAAFSAPLSALTFVTEEHPPSNFLAYDKTAAQLTVQVV